MGLGVPRHFVFSETLENPTVRFPESAHFNLLVNYEQEYVYRAYGLSRFLNYR